MLATVLSETVFGPSPIFCGFSAIFFCKSLGHLQNRKTAKSRKQEKIAKSGNILFFAHFGSFFPSFCLFFFYFLDSVDGQGFCKSSSKTSGFPHALLSRKGEKQQESARICVWAECILKCCLAPPSVRSLRKLVSDEVSWGKFWEFIRDLLRKMELPS